MKMLCITAVVALVFAGCNRPSTEELSAKAKEAYDAKNYPAAIEHLTQIVQDYPESAARASRMFLAAYPRHPMAQSAQFELDNLGKAPEDLLPKDEVAERPVP